MRIGNIEYIIPDAVVFVRGGSQTILKPQQQRGWSTIGYVIHYLEIRNFLEFTIFHCRSSSFMKIVTTQCANHVATTW